jgi:hypothetical protein
MIAEITGKFAKEYVNRSHVDANFPYSKIL